jgi:NADH-quinone oxidoreductase subunit L
MFDLPGLMLFIPALPLAAAIITAALGPKLLKENSHWPVIAGIGMSLLASSALLLQVVGLKDDAAARVGEGFAQTHTYWEWAVVEGASETPDDALPTSGSLLDNLVGFNIGVTLRADALSAIMLVTVTFVSLLVAIYSVGYMHGDPGYWRFFSLIALFVFSMTMLVSASNFVLLYVFWEAVGVCSYLLIGYWYQKPSAAAAGKKAFLVNRVGDFGFAIGIFLLWTTYGTLNFHDEGGVAGILGDTRLNAGIDSAYVGGGLGLAICLCLMLGACGKSAQFPLHVWLPDAMEGPTPVSALIHAATMVTAGVYMVVRCTPLFFASVEAQQAVAVIGAFTALLAGLIAITQTDLKRVLAYSTVSQLGFMFLSLGCGSTIGIVAGMFHLFTHAFFKALLFLGSGSVMHAMGNVIDMRQFGGLRRLMPITCATFFVGSLALAGIAPFAGFFSKDMILSAVHERAHHPLAGGLIENDAGLFNLLFWSASASAFLTAFYTFRAFFKTFFGEERIPPEAGHHAHESPGTMTIPLIVLAVFAAAIGLAVEVTKGFFRFLETTPSLAFHELAKTPEVAFHGDIALQSTGIALLAIALAAYFYLGEAKQIDRLARWLGPLYHLSRLKFLFDEIYTVFIVWPLRLAAWGCYWVDRLVIDGAVETVGKIPPLVGRGLRRVQAGRVQSYSAAMVWGVVILVVLLIVLPALKNAAGEAQPKPAATSTEK